MKSVASDPAYVLDVSELLQLIQTNSCRSADLPVPVFGHQVRSLPFPGIF